MALPVQAGLVSFAVPEIINAGDDITVMINMNSEQGYVYDYTLLLSATEKSLPSGYLGGWAFAMIDLRGKYFHQIVPRIARKKTQSLNCAARRSLGDEQLDN